MRPFGFRDKRDVLRCSFIMDIHLIFALNYAEQRNWFQENNIKWFIKYVLRITLTMFYTHIKLQRFLIPTAIEKLVPAF